MNFVVKLAESDAELAAAGKVLLELRHHFEIAGLIAQIKEQQKDGYKIACLESDGKVVCVAGFVVTTKLAWGKHIYIDDLVTAERYRSSGAGTYLINWFKEYAQKRGCKEIHLDSGVQRFAAHRFYLRHGFNITSHHFATSNVS